MSCYDTFRNVWYFIVNRVDYQQFRKIMKHEYDSDEYIEEKWYEFSKDPLGFIFRRDERFFYDKLLEIIEKEGYRGFYR